MSLVACAFCQAQISDRATHCPKCGTGWGRECGSLRSLDVPSLLRLPSGCTFHPRCPLFEDGLCDTIVPGLAPVSATGGHHVACHVAAREAAAVTPLVAAGTATASVTAV